MWYHIKQVCNLSKPKHKLPVLRYTFRFPTPVLGAGLRTVGISLLIPPLYQATHKTPSKAKLQCSVPFSSSSKVCEAHSHCHHPFLLWSDFRMDPVPRPKITLEARWCVKRTTGEIPTGFVDFLIHYAFLKFNFAAYLKNINDNKKKKRAFQ